MAVKGLYISCMEWDDIICTPPFTISEDARFVMGPSYLSTEYRPIPFDDFSKSAGMLKDFCLLNSSDMRESIDEDRLNSDDLKYRHYLVNGALVRTRKDSRGIDSMHTLMIVGTPDSVLSASERLELPHPFEDALYPYKKMFVDPSKTEIRALM